MEDKEQQSQLENKKWFHRIVGTIILLLLIWFFTGSNNDFEKVLSLTGNQKGRSEEFAVTSKEVKFVYKCESGIFFCGGRLYEVGGTNYEIFRSSGGTGSFSGEKILSVGPGNFYIEINTGDRDYKVDVFQGAISASTEEIISAQKKVDDSNKYRNINGFKFVDENTINGVSTDWKDYSAYYYETGDGIYKIELNISPSDMINSKLEEDYTLGRGALEVNGIDIQYAFNEGYKLNGVEFSKPYEDAEFIFITGNKRYIGWVGKNGYDNIVDPVETELIIKTFLNSLIPDVLGE